MADKQWSEMTPYEKRQERYRAWLAADGFEFDSPEAAKKYRERVQRFIDAFNVEEPDRVPVSLPVGSMPVNLYGTDYYTCSYDYEKAAEVFDRFNEHFQDADDLPGPGSVVPARVYDILDLKLYSWPGHGLPRNTGSAQFNEGEYMFPEEYDLLINNPSDFWMRRFLPRIFGALQPLESLNSLTTIFESPWHYFAAFGNPEMQQALDTMKEAGDEVMKFLKVVGEFGRKTKAAGFPSTLGGMAKAPFDMIGDTLRGTKGIIMDMRRRPEKLLEALDIVTEFTIRQTLESTRHSGGVQVMFPLHKGADGWMSDKQFQTFYWPYLKKVVDALIEEGLLVYLFAEGAYETRLDSVNECPKGAVSWLFDRTDMGKAKKALGDKCCIAGNVPTSLVITGTQQQVTDYCRNLIETCAPGGGFVLTGGAMADAGDWPNIRAMLDAALKYGVYKK